MAFAVPAHSFSSSGGTCWERRVSKPHKPYKPYKPCPKPETLNPKPPFLQEGRA